MSGIASICIGRRGCGKTTFTKELLEKRKSGMPVIIYDINKEYTDIYDEEFVDFDIFLEKISDEKVRRHYLVIEEATIFFNTHSNSEAMKNVLVRARHTGNIIQLNFHSFSSVPKGIYTLLDYVTVFKTNDNEKNVTDRFDHPQVVQAYREAKESADPYFHKVVSLY